MKTTSRNLLLPIVIACMLTACGGSSTDVGDGGGATVTGNMLGFTASLDSERTSLFARIRDLIMPEANADISGVMVTIGTLSTAVATPGGTFTLTNVPTGNQTVVFSQSGSSASYALNSIGDEETFTLTDVDVNGSEIMTALTGTWAGTITSSDLGVTLAMTMTIPPNTNTFTGTASDDIGDEWSISGTENGTTAAGTADVVGGPCIGDSAVFEGSFSNNNTITGTYSSGGGVCNPSNGEFNLTKQ